MGIVVDTSSSKVDGYTAAFQFLGAHAAIVALVRADPIRDRELLRATR
ncbi:hypothetical protein ACFXNW_19010 [Nocardia sp. NPDC059180]